MPNSRHSSQLPRYRPSPNLRFPLPSPSPPSPLPTRPQLTRDGHVVVFHDTTLGRMCGWEQYGSVRIADLSYDQLPPLRPDPGASMYRKAKAKGRVARETKGGEPCCKGGAGMETSSGSSSCDCSSCYASSRTPGSCTAAAAAAQVAVAVEAGRGGGGGAARWRCPGSEEVVQEGSAQQDSDRGPQQHQQLGEDDRKQQQQQQGPGSGGLRPWRWWRGQGRGGRQQHRSGMGAGAAASVDQAGPAQQHRCACGEVPLAHLQVVVATGEAGEALQAHGSPTRLSGRWALPPCTAHGHLRPGTAAQLRSSASGIPGHAGASPDGLGRTMSLPALRPAPQVTQAPTPAPLAAASPSLQRTASSVPTQAHAPPAIPTPSPRPQATNTLHVSAPRPRPSPLPPTLVTCWCGPEAGPWAGYTPTTGGAERSGSSSSSNSSTRGAEASDVEAASGSLSRTSSSYSSSCAVRASCSPSTCRLSTGCEPLASAPAQTDSHNPDFECGSDSLRCSQSHSTKNSSGGDSGESGDSSSRGRSSCRAAHGGCASGGGGGGPWADHPGGRLPRGEAADNGDGGQDNAVDGSDAGPYPHYPSDPAYDRIPLLDHVFAAFPHVPVQARRGGRGARGRCAITNFIICPYGPLALRARPTWPVTVTATVTDSSGKGCHAGRSAGTAASALSLGSGLGCEVAQGQNPHGRSARHLSAQFGN